MPSADVTAAILAGGAGRRVGGDDKGLMALAGKPLIKHVIAALRDQADRILICANRNLDAYAQFGTFVADAKQGFHGPLAGIATALVHCRTLWLLTVPVDAPEPPRDLLRRLRASADGTGADAAVAHDGERRQPLFALYKNRFTGEAEAGLGAGLAVHRWQDRIGAVEVDFSDSARSFANLNTLEAFRDWERVHEC